jgi:hypothetical protein
VTGGVLLLAAAAWLLARETVQRQLADAGRPS